MFLQKDKDYIIEQLIKNLSPEDKPRQVLTAPFFNTNFAQNLIQGNAIEMAVDAVRLCMSDGWNHDPMWMQMLLDIYQLRTVDAKIREIWEGASQKPPAIANPLEFTILNNSIPFVNRKTLRAQLNKLESANANLQPILVVSGDEKSGKSYSTNYIDHFCNIKTTIITYSISIENGKEMEMGALEVARDLVLMMGASLDNLPQPNTNLKKYTTDLALWVLNKAARSDNQHWFILDNFNIKGLRPDTRDLLIALSDSVTKGIFPRKCRLIIIGFDRAQLTVDPGKIDEEIVAPCTPDDIHTTITEILERGSSVISAASLDEIRNYIKTNLPAGKDKMIVLNDRLRILLYAVIQVSSILSGSPDFSFEEVLKEMLSDLHTKESPMEVLKSKLKILEESKKDM